MTTDALLAIAHHLLAFTLVGLLMVEWSMLRGAAHADVLARLSRVDLVYGIVAGLLVVVGVLRVSFGLKGYAFYTGNPVFWLKIALFALAGLLSIIPTIRFIRWARAAKAHGAMPDAAQWKSARKLVIWQLHALAGVMICAALMARGIGH